MLVHLLFRVCFFFSFTALYCSSSGLIYLDHVQHLWCPIMASFASPDPWQANKRFLPQIWLISFLTKKRTTSCSLVLYTCRLYGTRPQTPCIFACFLPSLLPLQTCLMMPDMPFCCPRAKVGVMWARLNTKSLRCGRTSFLHECVLAWTCMKKGTPSDKHVFANGETMIEVWRRRTGSRMDSSPQKIVELSNVILLWAGSMSILVLNISGPVFPHTLCCRRRGVLPHSRWRWRKHSFHACMPYPLIL